MNDSDSAADSTELPRLAITHRKPGNPESAKELPNLVKRPGLRGESDTASSECTRV